VLLVTLRSKLTSKVSNGLGSDERRKRVLKTSSILMDGRSSTSENLLLGYSLW
jgi:hypothetical protein